MNNPPTIRQATSADFDALVHLYRTCGKAMWNQGYDNWGDFYPPVETIQQDLRQQTLFVLKEQGTLLGAIALDFVQPAVYQSVTWQYHGKILAVHRLVVALHHQKRGLGKVLMNFAEAHAQALGCDAIRFDAYSINQPLLKFYQNLGYQMTPEAVSLGERWPHLFNCFEKRIMRP